MTATMTRPEAEIVITDVVTSTGDPSKCAHIVKTPKGIDARTYVLESRVMGFELEALCGYKWFATKDPKNLPVCQKCKEIWDMYGMNNPGEGFDDGIRI